jgi:hypothetical protein
MFVNWTIVYLLWDRCVCKLDCGVLAVGQMCLSTGLLCTCFGADVFVNWTVGCLLWDRCVCKLDCGVLAVGQMRL